MLARRCAADPGYDAAREAEQALLQPLFTTAFLIDDFLHDSGNFGARQVLLSSASSKTAYATASCLARRGDAVATLGRTSPAHAAFVRSGGRRGCRRASPRPWGAFVRRVSDPARPWLFGGPASLVPRMPP